MSSLTLPRKVAVIVLLAGLLLTATISTYFSYSARLQWYSQAHADMERISQLLVFRLQLAYEPALGLSMLMQGSREVTPQEFSDALLLTRQDDIGIQRSHYAFVMTDAAGQHVQLTSDDRAALAVNFTMDNYAPFNQAALRARSEKITAGPIFTDSDQHQKLFFVIPTGSQVQQGYMLALTDLTAMMADLCAQHMPVGLSFELQLADDKNNLVHSGDKTTPSRVKDKYQVNTDIAGEPWALHWRLHENYLGGHHGRLSFVVMIAGALISLLTAFLAFLWLTHRHRAAQLKEAYDALRNANQQLIKSEKMASLGSLVAGIAHELNTPIGNSLTVATALHEKSRAFKLATEEGAIKKSQLNDFLGVMEEATQLLEHNTKRAAQLISNFKQVAVDQSSERRRSFNLKQAIEETLWTIEPTLKHTRHTVNSDISADIYCDSFPGAIGQILNNLIANSLQHGFEHQAEGHIKIRAKSFNGMVQLDYIDDGCGIAQEYLNKVFDPFFTTKLGKGGSGLGLHIIYNLVTGLLGGEIRIESVPGQGLHLMIQFPLIAPAATELATSGGTQQAHE